jgi:flagellar biosynthesis/type III secretory pathway chaperone
MKELCDMLDDEIERQQNVGSVCIAQHDALCARDVELIDARNTALELLARDAELEANERQATVFRIAKALGLAPERTRLRDLAAHAPEPWKARLSDRRVALREVVQSNQRMVRRNQLIASKSRAIADDWRKALFEHLGESGPAYRGDGHTSISNQDGPAVIDQRG